MAVSNAHLKKATDVLKKAGVRITPQRHAIIKVLINSNSHPTADNIYQSLKDSFPNMSVATVYNNLRVFKEIGLIKELAYGDSSSRFDFSTSNHYHAICTNCNKIADFDYPGLDEVEYFACRVTGFEIDKHRLEVYGLCPNCKEENEQKQKPISKKDNDFKKETRR